MQIIKSREKSEPCLIMTSKRLGSILVQWIGQQIGYQRNWIQILTLLLAYYLCDPRQVIYPLQTSVSLFVKQGSWTIWIIRLFTALNLCFYCSTHSGAIFPTPTHTGKLGPQSTNDIHISSQDSKEIFLKGLPWTQCGLGTREGITMTYELVNLPR